MTMTRVYSGRFAKKVSMPAIVGPSKAFLLAGRDKRSRVTGPRWVTVRLSGKTSVAELSLSSRAPLSRLGSACELGSTRRSLGRELLVKSKGSDIAVILHLWPAFGPLCRDRRGL